MSLTGEPKPWLQVYCVSWNMVRRNVFLSGSWDDSIKLWDMNSPSSLATFKEHTYCVYAANWCAIFHTLFVVSIVVCNTTGISLAN